MLDTMLPLRMDRMHVKEQSETSKISCPQELRVDEEDSTVACPNLYPQSYLTKEQISILGKNIYYQAENHGDLCPESWKISCIFDI